MAQRLSNIVDATTDRVFRYACLGLFERHKLMFAAHLAMRIQVCLAQACKPSLHVQLAVQSSVQPATSCNVRENICENLQVIRCSSGTTCEACLSL